MEVKYHLPRVVKLRMSGGIVVQGCDVYIGRRLTMGGWDLQESPWANPYKSKEYGSAECIRLYDIYIRERLSKDVAMAKELLKMVSAGRQITLGCWCKKKGTESCHGDVIVELCQRLIDVLKKHDSTPVRNDAPP